MLRNVPFLLLLKKPGALSPFPVRQSMNPLTLTAAGHRYDLGLETWL
jgi:hypothetical protein